MRRMKRYRANIDNTPVAASWPYIVYSESRGLIGASKTRNAVRTLLKVGREKASDATIYQWSNARSEWEQSA